MARKLVVFVVSVESEGPHNTAGALEAVKLAAEQIQAFQDGRGTEAQAMVFHDSVLVRKVVGLDKVGSQVDSRGYFLEAGGFLGT